MLQEPVREVVVPDGQISGQIIGGAIRVHRELGPRLLESAYRRCLAFDLASAGLPVACEVPLPLVYRGLEIDCCYRVDLIVADEVLVEVKAVQTLRPLHEAQLLTYLRLSGLRTGLLLNFNVPILRDGIIRRVL